MSTATPPPPAAPATRTFSDGQAAASAATFTDRRSVIGQSPGVERRQFAATRDSRRPEVNELAAAIDDYKLQNRRRFITVDELYDIVTGLGYRR